MIEIGDIIIARNTEYKVIDLDDINYHVKYEKDGPTFHLNREGVKRLIIESKNWKHIPMYKKKQFDQQLEKLIYEN